MNQCDKNDDKIRSSVINQYKWIGVYTYNWQRQCNPMGMTIRILNTNVSQWGNMKKKSINFRVESFEILNWNLQKWFVINQ